MKSHQESIKRPDMYIVRRLVPYLKAYRGLTVLGVLAMLMAYTLSVTAPVVVQRGIDQEVLNGDMAGLRLVSLLLIMVLVGELIFGLIYRYVVEYLGQKVLFKMRMNLIDKVFAMTRSYFDVTPIGSTLTRLTSDLDAIEEFISDGVVSIIGNSFKVLFILVAMFIMDIQLSMVTLFTVPLFLLVSFFFRRALRSGYRGVRKANAGINTLLVESLNGIKELHFFKRKQKSIRQFDVVNRDYLISFQRIIRGYSMYFPSIEIISNLSMLLVLFMAHAVLKVDVRLGEVFAFFIYLNMFFQPLRQLAEQFNVFQSAMASCERIFVLLDKKPDFEGLIDPMYPTKKPALMKKIDVEFRNVHFAYKPDEPVLKGVSFKICSGEKVALVGSTGAGKTTVVNLLNRLYDIQEGAILINGKHLKEIPSRRLIDNIATVTQQGFMFTGTIAENIHLGKYSRKEMLDAAKRSYVHHFIEKFPLQYEHPVLEGGKSLSTGQKQMIALARAFIKKSPFIILDEATANIDSYSESLIEKALQSLFRDKTVLIIAHRLSTIQNADRILVFHHGMLVEEGNHHALVRHKRGIYRKLYEMQSLSLQANE